VNDLGPRERRAGTTEHGQRRNLHRPALPEPLPHPVVDTHCHLDVADGKTDLSPSEAITEAARVGVTRIVQVGCDVEGSRWAVEAAKRWSNVIASVAIHPNDAARLGDDLDQALAEIEKLAVEIGVRAVGETGLDYFRTRDLAGQAIQKRAFAFHIELAKRCDRTLVIHDRDAHAGILEVLDAEGVPDRIVMHCFSGDADFARACLDRGAYLSFGGTLTFKKSDDLRAALAITPPDRVLTETDAPYLTPEPYRGRPNASYLIPYTAAVIADVLDRDLAEVCRHLNDNATAAFGGPWPELSEPGRAMTDLRSDNSAGA
jgi:TatD DNase family protein